MEIYIFGPAYTYARALSHPPHVLTDGHPLDPSQVS